MCLANLDQGCKPRGIGMFSEFTIMVRFSGSCESSLLESEEDIKSLWGLEFISTKQLSKMISSSKYFPQNFFI